MENSEYRNESETSAYNERYFGYMADLVYKLSQVVGFHYDIELVPDSSYGYLRQDGSWDGLVGQLVTEVGIDSKSPPEYLFSHCSCIAFNISDHSVVLCAKKRN